MLRQLKKIQFLSLFAVPLQITVSREEAIKAPKSLLMPVWCQTFIPWNSRKTYYNTSPAEFRFHHQKRHLPNIPNDLVLQICFVFIFQQFPKNSVLGLKQAIFIFNTLMLSLRYFGIYIFQGGSFWTHFPYISSRMKLK